MEGPDDDHEVKLRRGAQKPSSRSPARAAPPLFRFSVGHCPDHGEPTASAARSIIRPLTQGPLRCNAVRERLFLERGRGSGAFMSNLHSHLLSFFSKWVLGGFLERPAALQLKSPLLNSVLE